MHGRSGSVLIVAPRLRRIGESVEQKRGGNERAVLLETTADGIDVASVVNGSEVICDPGSCECFRRIRTVGDKEHCALSVVDVQVFIEAFVGSAPGAESRCKVHRAVQGPCCVLGLLIHQRYRSILYLCVRMA